MSADSDVGARVIRIVAISWIVAFALYFGTCAAYRPLGFEAIQASRFGFLATSAICLAALAAVGAALAAARPGGKAAALYLVATLASSLFLSFLMAVCYMP